MPSIARNRANAQNNSLLREFRPSAWNRLTAPVVGEGGFGNKFSRYSNVVISWLFCCGAAISANRRHA
jgi:phage terminase Nu1 subunit (DNA packaging protein)